MSIYQMSVSVQCFRGMGFQHLTSMLNRYIHVGDSYPGRVVFSLGINNRYDSVQRIRQHVTDFAVAVSNVFPPHCQVRVQLPCWSPDLKTTQHHSMNALKTELGCFFMLRTLPTGKNEECNFELPKGKNKDLIHWTRAQANIFAMKWIL